MKPNGYYVMIRKISGGILAVERFNTLEEATKWAESRVGEQETAEFLPEWPRS